MTKHIFVGTPYRSGAPQLRANTKALQHCFFSFPVQTTQCLIRPRTAPSKQLSRDEARSRTFRKSGSARFEVAPLCSGAELLRDCPDVFVLGLDISHVDREPEGGEEYGVKSSIAPDG